jgi:poly-gamma-glutamate synthesis protein (capsule biosynthesis protein)
LTVGAPWIALSGPSARAEPDGDDRLLVEASFTAVPAPPATEAPAVVTITLVGDTGFNGDRQPVNKNGALRHGQLHTWADIFSRIRGDISGDLVFANLESVVTLNNALRSEDKIFAFRSHPEGVRELAALGFNLLSTANNHTMDFGAAGALDTLEALDALHAEGLIKAHAGLGRNREEAGRPRAVSVKGSRVLLSALGIVSGGLGHHRASATRPGQLAYQSAEDFEEAIRRLAEAEGDYRILSVHHGQERVVHTGPEAIRKLRREAVLGRGIDLVVGHHAHVVAGSEITNGRLILYGLGNFLHHGMQSSAHLGLCKDFGLMIRVHLLRDDNGRLTARAVEAIALTDMHVRAARMAPAAGIDRMHVLNHLAAALDDPVSGARGLRFTPRRDGTGLHCVAGAEDDPAPIGPMCRGLEPAPPVPVELRPRLIAACGNASPMLVATEPRASERLARRGAPGPVFSTVSATSGFPNH